MAIQNENGYILVTSLLLLLVLTMIGIAAIGTTTVSTILSGNINLRGQNTALSDAGTQFSIGVIKKVLDLKRSQNIGFTNFICTKNDTMKFYNQLPIAQKYKVVCDTNNIEEESPFDADSLTLSVSVTNRKADVVIPYDSSLVLIDIDKMYSAGAPGSKQCFACEYEGNTGSGNNIEAFYRIIATSFGAAGSEASGSLIYRYVQ
jgi:Tfp pilus assembly protein PilX